MNIAITHNTKCAKLRLHPLAKSSDDSLGERGVKRARKLINRTVHYPVMYRDFIFGVWNLEDEDKGFIRTRKDYGDRLRDGYKCLRKESPNADDTELADLFRKKVQSYSTKKLAELELPENEELAKRAIEKGLVCDYSDLTFDL